MKKVKFVMHTMIGRGAENVLIEILEKLDASKYKIELFLLIKTGPVLERIPSSINVSYLTLGDEFFSSKLLLFVNRIKRKIKIWLYCHFPNIFTRKSFVDDDVCISFLQWYTARMVNRLNIKAKKISWIHIDLSKTSGKYCNKLDFSEFDEMVFVSEQAKLGYEEFTNKKCLNANVIYNLVDENRIKILGLQDFESPLIRQARLKVCCVGSLTSQKRFDKAILAVIELVNKGHKVDLHIIGAGQLLPELKLSVSNNNAQDFIFFWGYQPNPYKIINQCDIFLLSSDFEGFGLVVAEAMILGLPVICTKCAGPLEITKNGEFGILIGNDISDIGNAIINFENESVISTWSSLSYLGWNRLKSMNDIKEVENILD